MKTHALAPILTAVSDMHFKPNVLEVGGRNGGDDLGYWVWKIMGRDTRSRHIMERLTTKNRNLENTEGDNPLDLNKVSKHHHKRV